ncbi:hypothetical protein HHK36_013678 [Tetracentron sinense]|uniref:Uncharacterized protein n=1 Tax=Tetracentron sinense TaxID=13715 RepID=A0A834Z6R4_TETSI|nr:hypothetical protein HHK36_013678 [Tetracentron sinense]
MGILFTRMFSSIFGSREARILVLGLDNAGKTTILCTFSSSLWLSAFAFSISLYRLQMGEVVSTIPTIGFNVETVEYNNIKFQVWDLVMFGFIIDRKTETIMKKQLFFLQPFSE